MLVSKLALHVKALQQGEKIRNNQWKLLKKNDILVLTKRIFFDKIIRRLRPTLQNVYKKCPLSSLNRNRVNDGTSTPPIFTFFFHKYKRNTFINLMVKSFKAKGRKIFRGHISSSLQSLIANRK